MVEAANCVADDGGLAHRNGVRDAKGAGLSNINHQ